jgi:hypothetical protein
MKPLRAKEQLTLLLPKEITIEYLYIKQKQNYE